MGIITSIGALIFCPVGYQIAVANLMNPGPDFRNAEVSYCGDDDNHWDN